MHKIALILITLISAGDVCSQNIADTIKKLAIDCPDWTKANQSLYNRLKNYRVICIGEMHGTQEPAEFLTGLARSFVSNKRKVMVGFEIPAGEMADFIEQNDSLNLSRSEFFLKGPSDGRNSIAWYNAINTCRKMGAGFCFFDSGSDKGMYDRVLECYQSDTSAVLITLSGNVHNKLLPCKDIKTMGCYLAEKFGEKVFSINHIYNEGTMYNRSSQGLTLRRAAPKNNAFSTSTSYGAYFIPNIFNQTDGYSAYFYTKTVKASLPWKK